MIAYRLKRPRRHGAPELVLTPLEFLGRLATLIPPPRRHLTRYHGVFAPTLPVEPRSCRPRPRAPTTNRPLPSPLPPVSRPQSLPAVSTGSSPWPAQRSTMR